MAPYINIHYPDHKKKDEEFNELTKTQKNAIKNSKKEDKKKDSKKRGK